MKQNKGGYDDGYTKCRCFWGTTPGSLLKRLTAFCQNFDGLQVLDAGCGEGKNAAYLASLGASVRAVDVSSAAISNALATWGDIHGIVWEVADLRESAFPENHYDISIAYGLMHCLSSPQEIQAATQALKATTKAGGFILVCAFNDRHQELSAAHPDFDPTLVSHSFHMNLYSDWSILFSEDADLFETHPHNNIPHTHSLTRLIAQKPYKP
jgi:tellurite methyltransferase